MGEQLAELLRKQGVLDGSSMQIIAQAYYQLGDYRGCSHYIMNNFGSGAGEGVLQLQMRCAYESQDNESMRTALETLVARLDRRRTRALEVMAVDEPLSRR